MLSDGHFGFLENKFKYVSFTEVKMLLCLDLVCIWAGVIDKKWLERVGGVILGPKRSKMGQNDQK